MKRPAGAHQAVSSARASAVLRQLARTSSARARKTAGAAKQRDRDRQSHAFHHRGADRRRVSDEPKQFKREWAMEITVQPNARDGVDGADRKQREEQRPNHLRDAPPPANERQHDRANCADRDGEQHIRP
jgi:hypothetical protein